MSQTACRIKREYCSQQHRSAANNDALELWLSEQNGLETTGSRELQEEKALLEEYIDNLKKADVFHTRNACLLEKLIG